MRALTRRLLIFSTVMAGAPANPSRIVSTAPSLTEILFALGLGPQVAGVTEYCLYPPEAASKPRIGTFLQPSIERILALKPDLVLTITNPVQLSEKLRRAGLKVEEFTDSTTSDIFTALHRIGQIASRQSEAAKLAESIRRDFASVRAAAASLPRKRVLFLVGRAPSTFQDMYGAGPGTFIDELLTLAGGINVLSGAPMPYPKVGLEQILTVDPDIILDMGNLDHAAGRPLQPEGQVLALWAQHPQLRAVRNRQVRVVAGELYIRPGPRMGQAAGAYFKLLQGPR